MIATQDPNALNLQDLLAMTQTPRDSLGRPTDLDRQMLPVSQPATLTPIAATAAPAQPAPQPAGSQPYSAAYGGTMPVGQQPYLDLMSLQNYGSQADRDWLAQSIGRDPNAGPVNLYDPGNYAKPADMQTLINTMATGWQTAKAAQGPAQPPPPATTLEQVFAQSQLPAPAPLYTYMAQQGQQPGSPSLSSVPGFYGQYAAPTLPGANQPGGPVIPGPVTGNGVPGAGGGASGGSTGGSAMEQAVMGLLLTGGVAALKNAPDLYKWAQQNLFGDKPPINPDIAGATNAPTGPSGTTLGGGAGGDIIPTESGEPGFGGDGGAGAPGGTGTSDFVNNDAMGEVPGVNAPTGIGELADSISNGVPVSNEGATQPFFDFMSGDPALEGELPPELIAAFNGDAGAAQAAVENLSHEVTPELVMQMADAGELTDFGITSASQLTPEMASSIGNVVGIAGIVLAGLKAAGVVEGDAAQVASGLMGVASAAMTGLALTSEGGLAAMSTLGALSSVAGGVTAVAAPFIAWGLHELEASMRPDFGKQTRELSAEMYNQSVAGVNNFNALAAEVLKSDAKDPATYNAMMQLGEKAVLDFYTRFQEVGAHLGIPGVSESASPSGNVGASTPEQQAQMMAPFKQAMQYLNQLKTLGGTYGGANDWYGIFGGQLNPYSLNAALYGAGSASANPLGLQAAQYGERFTPEQLKMAAGGMDPLAFALRQWGIA